ncbi:MAG TPA: hypothetical protein VIN09_08430 [Chloroflexota bacterium]
MNRSLPVLLDDGTRQYVWGVGPAHTAEMSRGDVWLCGAARVKVKAGRPIAATKSAADGVLHGRALPAVYNLGTSETEGGAQVT